MENNVKKKRVSPNDFPFQFMFKINGNIICQRGFNVRNYNQKVITSYELRELMDRLVGMGDKKGEVMGLIPKHLKNQSEDYMWNWYNPYNAQTVEEIKESRKMPIRKDYFSFEISHNDFIISKSVFENKFMLYSVNNQVNITEIIHDILNEIVYTFTLKEFTSDYLDVDLSYRSPIWKYGESLRG